MAARPLKCSVNHFWISRSEQPLATPLTMRSCTVGDWEGESCTPALLGRFSPAVSPAGKPLSFSKDTLPIHMYMNTERAS